MTFSIHFLVGQKIALVRIIFLTKGAANAMIDMKEYNGVSIPEETKVYKNHLPQKDHPNIVIKGPEDRKGNRIIISTFGARIYPDMSCLKGSISWFNYLKSIVPDSWKIQFEIYVSEPKLYG